MIKLVMLLRISALMDLAKKLGVEIPKGLTKEMLYSSLDKQPKLAHGI